MAWYRIAENVLTAMANAINAKTGKTAPLTPVEMVAEIQDMPSGGEEYFYNPRNGTYYTANLDVVISDFSVSNMRDTWRSCNNLLSAKVGGLLAMQGGNNANMFGNCQKLNRLILPDFGTANTYIASECPLLETVQLGSIGKPVTMLSEWSFHKDTQSNLTITIYVADDATLPLTNSPFGATNATIIYRSATTGEVITV